MSDLLTVDHISKAFGNLLAVDKVSLTIPKGKIVGLIGPNGSGKSTLLNVVSATLPSDAGTITFDQRDITGLNATEVFQLGLVRSFQGS